MRPLFPRILGLNLAFNSGFNMRNHSTLDDHKKFKKKLIAPFNQITSFLRFLEIAKKIDKPVSVVTDNDGKVDAVKTKYEDYLGDNKPPHISIHFDEDEDTGEMANFNYNTLEPKLVKAAGMDKLNTVFKTSFGNSDDLCKYMKSKKTDCAMRIFDTEEDVKFPQYILDAIDFK